MNSIVIVKPDTVNGSTHGVDAEGEAWPHPFEIAVSSETQLPSRFMAPRVEVSYYDGVVHFGRDSYNAEEAVTSSRKATLRMPPSNGCSGSARRWRLTGHRSRSP